MEKTLGTNLTDLPINLAALISTLARKNDLAALLQGLKDTELTELEGVLSTLQSEIGALKGQLNYRGVKDFETATPLPSALTNFVKLSRPEVVKGDTIINTFNNDE
jgi:hypothetical protein